MDAVQNLSALRKKQFMVKFDLDGTTYSAIENIGSGTFLRIYFFGTNY